ncbi:MAG: tRNA epoxyqueuosine(34) reductase QueG [Rhodobacterales bacterium]|nr:tRNA epoxyqueuosine(34) reductase QueG [Rhodobacterales bacterium]
MAPNRTTLTAIANAVGFDTVGFTDVVPTPRFEAYQRWIAEGHHGDMHYLDRNADVRADPRNRLAGAKSAMVLAVHHHHERPDDPGGRTGLVARYAWGRDYHNLMGKRLKKLHRRLREAGLQTWGGVDTAPILERTWAQAAGLGTIGKNTMLFAPGNASWMLLAVVFIDVEVPPDAPRLGDFCKTCTRCLDACPTDAFVGPRTLDSRRCIAYWTIENRGIAPRELRAGFGRWAFGCDICQEVCPHNHGPPPSDEDDLLPRNAWLDLDDLLASPDDDLMDRFLGTPLRRPGAAGLKRNAAIVLGNLGDDGAVDSLRTHGLIHSSPVVRAASVWSLKQLGATDQCPASDPDEMVLDEIRA